MDDSYGLRAHARAHLGIGTMLAAHEAARIMEHAEALFPLVCCGVVMARSGDPADRVVIACDNAQDDAHAEDPETYPLTSRDGYFVRPLDLLRIATLESRGYAVAVIYYSRVDRDASFPDASRRAAAPDGRPMHPNAVYLPVSVIGGRVADTRAFQWDPSARDFVEIPLATSAPDGPRRTLSA